MCLCEGWRLRCAMCVGVVLCKGFEGLFDCAFMCLCVSCSRVYIMCVCTYCICVYIVYACAYLARAPVVCLYISVCLSVFIQLCSYMPVCFELGDAGRCYISLVPFKCVLLAGVHLLWGEASLIPLMFYWMYNKIFGPCIVISFEPKANVTVYGVHIYYDYRISQL